MDTNLNAKEVFLMRYIVNKAKNNNFSCIINNDEILDFCPEKYKLTALIIQQTLAKLENDGYFELTISNKKGEQVYIIKLSAFGKAFERSQEQKRREINHRLMWNVIFAALGALVATLVRAFFN